MLMAFRHSGHVGRSSSRCRAHRDIRLLAIGYFSGRAGSFRQLLPAKIQTVLSLQSATISPVASVAICLISLDWSVLGVSEDGMREVYC